MAPAAPSPRRLSMFPRRRRFLLAAVTLLVMLGAVVAFQKEPETIQIRVVFGLKDQKPRSWSGSVSVAGGEVTALSGWRFEGTDDSVSGVKSWTATTHNGI